MFPKLDQNPQRLTKRPVIWKSEELAELERPPFALFCAQQTHHPYSRDSAIYKDKAKLSAVNLSEFAVWPQYFSCFPKFPLFGVVFHFSFSIAREVAAVG